MFGLSRLLPWVLRLLLSCSCRALTPLVSCSRCATIISAGRCPSPCSTPRPPVGSFPRDNHRWCCDCNWPTFPSIVANCLTRPGLLHNLITICDVPRKALVRAEAVRVPCRVSVSLPSCCDSAVPAVNRCLCPSPFPLTHHTALLPMRVLHILKRTDRMH